MSSPFMGSLGAVIAPPPADAWQFPAAARAAAGPRRKILQLPVAPRDQLDLGSCVGQTFAYILAVLDGRGIHLSALQAYRLFRLASGFPANKDTGALAEASVRALVSDGIGSEAMGGVYSRANLALAPTAEYVQQAKDHRVLSWFRCRQIPQLQAAIDQGYPVGAFFEVPSTFSLVGQNGLWRDGGGANVGAHAVAAIGYDDSFVIGNDVGAVFIINWWRIAEGWGMNVPDHPNLPRCCFAVPYRAFAPGGRFFDAIAISAYDHTAGQPETKVQIAKLAASVPVLPSPATLPPPPTPAAPAPHAPRRRSPR